MPLGGVKTGFPFWGAAEKPVDDIPQRPTRYCLEL